jgi:hypothetical protein
MSLDTNSISEQAAIAAKEPTKFDPKERIQFIRSHVTQIKRMVQSKYTVDDIKSAFPDFSEKYPSLLEMLTRPGGYDEKSLTMMMTMIDKMGSSSKVLTQHEASISIGQHLLNTYVKPQLDGQL